MRDLRRNRRIVVKDLNAIEGLECRKPESTFYVFPWYDFDMEFEVLAERYLREAVVVLGRVLGRWARVISIWPTLGALTHWKKDLESSN